MKTILKVVYIAMMLIFTVILGIQVYTLEAAGNYSSQLTAAIQKADEEKDYKEIARTFSIFETPLDSKPVVLEQTTDGKNICFIYSSINAYIANYTTDGKDQKIYTIEDVYLFTILHPNFYRNSTSNGENKSAIRFYGEKGYYDYYFVQNESVNASNYIAKPTTEYDATMHGAHACIENYSDYDLLFAGISKSEIGFISDTTGKITGFNVLDNTGSAIYATNVMVNLDFSQDFFKDMEDFRNKLDIVTKYKNGDETISSDECTAASQALEEFDITTVGDGTYIQGIARDSVYTGTPMVMKSLGTCLLFVLCAALIYIVLFHLKKIRALMGRITGKNTYQVKETKVVKKAPVVVSPSGVHALEEENKEVKEEASKVDSTEDKKEESLEDEPLEETK